MNGFDKLKEQMKGKINPALIETVEYLLTRDDLQEKYLNEEKSVDEMEEFITKKGRSHLHNGWNYITNEVVFAWAVMYYSFPNSFLKISKKGNQLSKKSDTSIDNKTNKVISMEKAKESMKQKEQEQQMSLFGGEFNE